MSQRRCCESLDARIVSELELLLLSGVHRSDKSQLDPEAGLDEAAPFDERSERKSVRELAHHC